ncbi:MAG TPA: AAA family ATPase [Acidimicrobiales bacterium]
MSSSENITVLFTDLVGSTELASSLTPDQADDVRRAHFAALRQAVTDAGGTEVKNLGDGIMVVFPTASTALSCAVAMQQGVHRDNRGLDRSLGIRVGLSIGEATREADDFFGDPVVEASRLCGAAGSGQILASDTVRVMAGRRNRHDCRPVGELDLKGLPDPVEAVEVAWEPIGGSHPVVTVPLPARLGVRPQPGVVGRGPELAQIAESVKRVTEGGGEVVLVSGEAGLGKTTLVAEAARAALASGALVLFGHCEEDLATPYQLFAEALGHFVTHAADDDLVAHVAAHGSELVRVVPALADRIPDLPPSRATDSDTERFLLFAAAVGLLAQISEARPVVLVLDDLQWADKGSLLLLRHLAASDRAGQVLVLGTYRDDVLSHVHPFLDTLAALRRMDGVSRIELGGLDDSGVIALMEAVAGYTLDPAAVGLAHAVYRETDGNPFFVSEVLRNLAETGAIFQDASGRWVAEGSLDQVALPDSVREVIGARVGRLGPGAERVLATAAVIGRDFDLDVLARSTGTDEDGLLDILEAAAAASLVREPNDASGRYSFAHALIQHTLYQDLGPNRRARVHRRVAEALEELVAGRPGDRVGELARHWVNASQPIDLAKAIGYSRQAGDAALAALAPGEALRYYIQALDLFDQAGSPDPVLGLDLAIGLGTAQRQSSEPVFRATLLDAARRAAELGDTDRLAAAALANYRGWVSAVGVNDLDKIGVLETALDRLPDGHPDRALVLANLCAEYSYGAPLEHRLALADEAVAIAEASGSDAVLLRVLNQVTFPLYVPHLADRLLDQTALAMDLAHRVGDPYQLYFAALWRSCVCRMTGDIAEGERASATMQGIATRLGLAVMHWVCLMGESVTAVVEGDIARAAATAEACLQVGTEGGEPDAVVFFGGHLLSFTAQAGTLDAQIPVIEQLLVDAPDLATDTNRVELAHAYAMGGRPDDARAILRGFVEGGCDLPLDALWLVGQVDFAWLAELLDDRDAAVALFDLLAPFADLVATNGGTTARGQVSRFLGGLATALGRLDEAEAYLTMSDAYNERAGARYFGADTDMTWGQMLVRRGGPGDEVRARARLTRCRNTSMEQGYGFLERRATGALAGLA